MALGMRRVKNRSQDRWLYSALYAHNLGSTFQKIGESTIIGVSKGIGTSELPTYYFSETLFMRGFIMDGNFQAEHMKMRNPENDISLSEGMGFMVSRIPYESHLRSAFERQQVSFIPGFATGWSSSRSSCSKRGQHAMITVQ